MSVFKVEDLKADEVSEVFRENFDANSELRKAGAREIRYDVDNLKVLSITGGAVIGESDTKPLGSIEVAKDPVHKLKAVCAYTFTDETLEHASGKEVVAAVLSSFSAQLTSAIDRAIILGQNPDGNAAEKASEFALITTDKEVQFQADDTVDEAFMAAEDQLGSFTNSALMSHEMYRRAKHARTSFGLPRYATNSDGKISDFDGVRGVLSSHLGYDSFQIVGGKKKHGAKNNNLAILGDFSKVRIATKRPVVKFFDTGTFGGVNLLETNSKLILGEMYFGVYVEPNEFVKITKAA